MFCPKCGVQNLDTNKFCKSCGRNLPDYARVLRQSQQFQYSAQSQSLIGQVLDGKYRLEAKLGAGGMGDVYRATRLLIGDTIAVKILHTHLSRDTQAAERFRREAQTAIRLKHRNVVQIYDVGISQTNNVPYILMELAEGFTLRQLLNHNRIMPLDFAVTLTAQICSALDEAHRMGIVHRDIKPENLIANQTATGWNVKVLDFGIAKLYNQGENNLTQDGSAMGTPQYMSPENVWELRGAQAVRLEDCDSNQKMFSLIQFEFNSTSLARFHALASEPLALQSAPRYRGKNFKLPQSRFYYPSNFV